MSKEKINQDLSSWLSSYGLVTAERLLGKYGIHLSQEQLIVAIKNPKTLYHRMLVVPVKNLMNGIILDHAKNYQIYAQKLTVDYLLSGEAEKDSSFSGAQTRENIEEKRKELLAMTEAFHQLELQHHDVIAESQKQLIIFSSQWKKGPTRRVLQKVHALAKEHELSLSEASLQNAFQDVVVYMDSPEFEKPEFSQKLTRYFSLPAQHPFLEQFSNLVKQSWDESGDIEDNLEQYFELAENIHEQLRSFRDQFYNLILQLIELLTSLSDYRFDVEQDKLNKEALHFDKDLL